MTTEEMEAKLTIAKQLIEEVMNVDDETVYIVSANGDSIPIVDIWVHNDECETEEGEEFISPSLYMSLPEGANITE